MNASRAVGGLVTSLLVGAEVRLAALNGHDEILPRPWPPERKASLRAIYGLVRAVGIAVMSWIDDTGAVKPRSLRLLAETYRRDLAHLLEQPDGPPGLYAEADHADAHATRAMVAAWLADALRDLDQLISAADDGQEITGAWQEQLARWPRYLDPEHLIITPSGLVVRRGRSRAEHKPRERVGSHPSPPTAE